TYLVEKENAKEDNEGNLSLAGQESSPPTTIAMVTFLHGQINSMMTGVVIPVTFRDKDERNGFYQIGSVDMTASEGSTTATTTSELTNYQNEVAKADWTISLIRGGSHTEVDLQSRLTGAVRQNDFSQTGERWHAAAIGHYGYQTGTTDVSSWVDRTGADGVVRVYRAIPANTHPRWGCDPLNYYGGRVRITDTLEVSTENEIEGLNHKLSTTGWTLSNGLVNVTATASAGIIDVQSYDPDVSASYRSTQWKIQRTAGTNIQAWQSVSIIRNTFEQCIIRLTANIVNTPGRVTLDLTLKRGSRFVEGYLQSSSSATLKVMPNNVTTSTSATSGTVVASSNDTNGNKPIIGSARTFTADTVNGGLSKAATTSLDFYIGAIIQPGGGAAQSGDAAADLQAQYIGTLPESTYIVRR
ncbi:MAG: hypothetical protein LC723_07845, partial [Actinobacteria bacterium]|nr:hypothetical protein [Actinomycetota bacterium]